MVKMSNSQIRVGRKQARYSASGYRVLSYFVEMSHQGLNEHKIISAPDEYMLENKIEIQKYKWTDKWAIVSSKRKINQERDANFEEAARRTEDATNAQEEIKNILIRSLSVNDAVNWEDLKKKENYPEHKPTKPYPKSKRSYPNRPVKEEPTFSFVENMIKSKKALKIKEYEDKYSNVITTWEKEKEAVDRFNSEQEVKFQEDLMNWEDEVSKWKLRESGFLEKQKIFNDSIEQMKKKYLSGNTDSILEYCDMVLNNSKYPDSFPKSFEIEYNPTNKMLIVEYELPSQRNIPKIKEVKYVAS